MSQGTASDFADFDRCETQLGTLLEDACPVCSRALEGDVVRCESCYLRTGEGFCCRSCAVPFGADDKLVTDPALASFWLCTVDYRKEKDLEIAAAQDVSRTHSDAEFRLQVSDSPAWDKGSDRVTPDATVPSTQVIWGPPAIVREPASLHLGELSGNGGLPPSVAVISHPERGAEVGSCAGGHIEGHWSDRTGRDGVERHAQVLVEREAGQSSGCHRDTPFSPLHRIQRDARLGKEGPSCVQQEEAIRLRQPTREVVGRGSGATALRPQILMAQRPRDEVSAILANAEQWKALARDLREDRV